MKCLIDALIDVDVIPWPYVAAMGQRERLAWDHGRYCAELATEVARFIDVVCEADPALPVPTCPGWTIADLIHHHGTTHRWVEHIVRHRATERVRTRDLAIDAPVDHAAFRPWLRRGADRLLSTLRATDPDAPMWTVGVDRRARFWPRRVLHEAVVHRADAELALRRRPDVDRETAIDGIHEFLGNLPCLVSIMKRICDLGRDGGSLRLHAPDAGIEWLVALRPDGFTCQWSPAAGSITTDTTPTPGPTETAAGSVVSTAPDRSSVTVAAPAARLLLLVYGRLRPSDPGLRVSGDGDLLVAWLHASAFG